MLKIKGHYYSQKEITDALVARGYTIVPFTYTVNKQWGNHDGYSDDVEIKSFCAIKGDEKPSQDNLLNKVASRIWNKQISKPKLV